MNIINVLSEKKINSGQEESPYYVIVDTSSKLEVDHIGGKDECILRNEFKSSSQTITLDLSLCNDRDWILTLRNPETQ